MEGERLKFSHRAIEDLTYWKKTNNTAVLKRIRKILESILEDPYKGIGKPEPLKHEFSGCWSRRINASERVVYELSDDIVIHIHSLRGHYY
jgi:toxin YoeB